MARTGEWQETIFKYPDDLDDAASYIARLYIGWDVYFCPTVLRLPKRIKENIDASRVAWADLDTCEPERLLVPPTLVIKTSRGRFQAFWKFNNPQHALDIEEINKRIAYRHKDEGCDTGWALTKYLRIPNTINHKYGTISDVTVVSASGPQYELADFDVYPKQDLSFTELSVPMPEQWPEETAEEIIESVKMSIHPRVWGLFESVPDTDWSKSLYELQMLLFGSGLDPERVFVVAKAAACNKYTRDQRSDELLWKEVLRLKEKSANQALVISEATDDGDEPDWYLPDRDILTEEERQSAQLRNTIVEDYIAWGKTVGDAAPQYHEAGAFIILSALLAGRVRLPTSYGVLVPNLWFMILADTTLTRKTTAMDLAMDMITEIDPDSILATDGSIEGLMNSLSTRPGRPSIFLRDEFSGLLEMMDKRDYYAGMLEMLTKLYDGKFQKRILKKEIIEVREPVLILFAGGIKERIYSLLQPNHINSGFVPRFCFITANSDLRRLRPLGPPTDDTIERRNQVLERLRDIFNHYTSATVTEGGDTPADLMFTKEWRATMDPDAWVRYNQILEAMLEIGIDSSRPDQLTPVMSRLCESGLKAAVLLAAAERLDDEVTVHIGDIIKAFSYVERWKQHALNVIANAGKTSTEKELENVYHFVQDNAGAHRSKIMQVFRLTARSADSIFTTLNQRGLVRLEKQGKGAERVYPMRVSKIHQSERKVHVH
jgi:hypothetical protein